MIPKKMSPAFRVVERPVVSLGTQSEYYASFYAFLPVAFPPAPPGALRVELPFVRAQLLRIGVPEKGGDGNLDLAFPRKTAAERKAIARQFYRNLADIVVETLKLLTISSAELGRRVTIANPKCCSNTSTGDSPSW
jgi:hypothetical protein